MHLKQLSNFSSWHLIRAELNKEVINIENDLFETDPKANERLFTLHDIKRAERKIFKLLTNMPEDLFDELKGFEIIPDENEGNEL